MNNDDERRKRFKAAHGSDPNGPSEYELHLAEEEAMKKEKRMMKLIGEYVVQSMNKYKEMMDHETFKRYAKEVS
jgi:histone-lysine N-methyltransferase SETD2